MNPQPENVPIAIVNEDVGITIPEQGEVNMGEAVLERINNASPNGEEFSFVRWIEVSDQESVYEDFSEKEYYGALIIPEDFSQKQASLRTDEPIQAQLDIVINEGKNVALATAATQMLTGMVEGLNENLRTQLLEEIEAQSDVIPVEQAQIVMNPIQANVSKVNEVGGNSANGNVPVTLFQPLWMGILASAAIIFLIGSKRLIHTRQDLFILRCAQVVMGMLAGGAIGFILPWLANTLIGFNIPHYLDTALFLTITAISFFLMFLAVMSLVGIKGIGLFALMLFFGAPLLSLAPEMMSSFYANWVYPWMPMRFMIDGLRDIFYFGGGLSWEIVSVLVGIAVVSLIVIALSVVMKTGAINKKQSGNAES